ncbi:MAG: hydrolase Nlp/P60 [Flavobacteriaceae bacterium]|nr:hydrolase Nlp/P60 [Flavobacteriaceae bacterium]
MYGICNLSIVPIRRAPSHSSEMVSQLLFGDFFTVIETENDWYQIETYLDSYSGYVHKHQVEELSMAEFAKLQSQKQYFAGEFIDYISSTSNDLVAIPIGSLLPCYDHQKLFIKDDEYSYEGKVYHEKLAKADLVQIAYLYLNTPYLWGGKTPFGIDCSGFTQMVYRLCGYHLFRDAKSQASQGEVLSFIEESKPGDLAFFDDEEGNINHVGIVLNNYQIIHAFGKVRIDTLDHSGIFNNKLQKHTHKLRIIKQIIPNE